MALNIKTAAERLSFLRRMPSVAFVLQAGACVVVAWSLWHGGLSARPAAALHTPSPPPASTPATSTTVPAPAATPAASEPVLASTSPLNDAQLALATMDVIVTRNDTLDRIFRRFERATSP